MESFDNTMSVAEETHSILFDLKALTQFDEQSPRATILADTNDAQLVLVAMHAGQQMVKIRTGSQIIAQCLRGRTTLHIGPNIQALRAGLVALIEADTVHSFVATTDCVLLLTLTPSPEHHAPAHAILTDAIPLVKRANS